MISHTNNLCSGCTHDITDDTFSTVSVESACMSREREHNTHYGNMHVINMVHLYTSRQMMCQDTCFSVTHAQMSHISDKSVWRGDPGIPWTPSSGSG